MDSITSTPKIAEIYGQSGLEWLERLPGILSSCADKWSLTLLPPFDNISYNYVVPAIQAGGRDVVLKASVVIAGEPDKEFVAEHDALCLYDGQGMVRLLDADLKAGVILLERLIPGTTLKTLADADEATQIAAELMGELWKPVPVAHTFPTVADWATGLQRLRPHFQGGCGPFPERLLDKAERLFNELIDSMDEAVLLHGDLHHENILMSQRSPWLGIDPKGVIGEPAYETGAFLRNLPIAFNDIQARSSLARAVDQLSDHLILNKQRIVYWGFAQAVLSAWWSFEDHGKGWEPALAWAELFDSLE